MRDWLEETENYSTRYERFLEEWDTGMSTERMIEWLQSAWDCAREGEKNDGDRRIPRIFQP
jgi:hypothetical protein